MVEKILAQSPWLLEFSRIESDIHLERLRKFPYIYRNKDFLTHEFQDGVYVLTGGRQVGKTTHLKMLIRDRITQALHKNFLYFNCDLLDSKQDIVTLVETYIEKIADRNNRIYVVLDEITSVRDGFLAVKYCVDEGYDANITWLLTGSSTINVKKTGEYLPGRRGKGIDFILRPLGFKEFVSLRFDMHDMHFSIDNLQTQRARIGDRVDLQKQLQNYLRHGGIPRVINEYYMNNAVDEEIFEIYRSWIISEIAKADKKEHLAKIMLERSMTSLGSDTSYNAFAQDMNVGSHNTVYDYLSFFEQSFILSIVYNMDIHSKKVHFRKNKKLYFADPFIYALCDKWLNARQRQDFAYLNEPVAASRLIENLVFLKLQSLYKEVHFYRNAFEIDFIAGDTLVECKYRRRIIPEDYKSMKKVRGKKIIVSKETLQIGDTLCIVPAELFLILDSL